MGLLRCLLQDLSLLSEDLVDHLKELALNAVLAGNLLLKGILVLLADHGALRLGHALVQDNELNLMDIQVMEELTLLSLGVTAYFTDSVGDLLELVLGAKVGHWASELESEA